MSTLKAVTHHLSPNSTLKKVMLILSAISFMVLGGACVTTAVLESKSYNTKTYNETVSSFLVSADKKNILVLGKDRHYLFHFKPKLQRILGSSINKKIHAEFNTFNLNTEKTTVRGNFRLKAMAEQVSAKEAATLKSLGFVLRSKTKTQPAHWQSYQYLSGKYYRAGNFALPQDSRYLNQSYNVKIRERSLKKSNGVRKALLTPLAIAADGALMIGAIPFLILGGATQ